MCVCVFVYMEQFKGLNKIPSCIIHACKDEEFYILFVVRELSQN